MNKATSYFDQVIESVESLSMEDQEQLVAIISRRLADDKREILVEEINRAREAFQSGQIQRGTVQDLMTDIES